MLRTIFYKLNSGKNSKFLYFTKACLSVLVPTFIYKLSRKRKLKEATLRKDWDYMLDRINYYNKLENSIILPQDSKRISDLKLSGSKAYYIDIREYHIYFNKNLRWNFIPGDVTKIPEIPSIVKSRPIEGDNKNSIIMKLNKIRHYIFVNDKKPFSEKKNMVVFMGKVNNKEKRVAFFKKFWGNPLFEIGAIEKECNNPEWKKRKMTIKEHLDYKFIMAIEGNDVSSNLKWIMSSNSIAVMSKPTYETWFMEGRLIPNYHYILVKDDYSDLEDKIDYYIKHQEEALKIIKNANEYVNQFKDKKREHLISLHVLNKYFEKVK